VDANSEYSLSVYRTLSTINTMIFVVVIGVSVIWNFRFSFVSTAED
jgi:hypothetical protein